MVFPSTESRLHQAERASGPRAQQRAAAVRHPGAIRCTLPGYCSDVSTDSVQPIYWIVFPQKSRFDPTHSRLKWGVIDPIIMFVLALATLEC